MSDTYTLLRSGARKLMLAAAILDRIRFAKGDEQGLLERRAAEWRAAAAEMAAHAEEVRPSAAVTNFTRGMREAMRNWHPTPYRVKS